MSAMKNERVRAEVAWILWCANAGYLLAEDRAVMENWFLTGSAATDHPDDAREAWLSMADIVIEAIRTSPDSGPSS